MRPFFLSITYVVLIGFSIQESSYAQIRINELSADNASILQDEDGDYSDWIELHNPTDTVISLSGLYLSDDALDLSKFPLPEAELAAFGYMLVFASDKNRSNAIQSWETIIKNGSNTKYIIPNAVTSHRWVEKDFDDSSWNTGVFGIGYGDGDDNTTVPEATLSVFTRSHFSIEDTSSLTNIFLHVDYDDAYVAYINGTEVSRANISGDAPLAYNQPADSYTEPKLPYGNSLDPINLNNYLDLLNPGANVLAIQVHNHSSGSSDLSLIPYLTVGYHGIQDHSVGLSLDIEIPAEQNGAIHTNFKLSSAGETVYLSDENNTVLDSLSYPELKTNESFGRIADTNNTGIFTQTTPGRINNTQAYTQRLAKPELSHTGGFFTESFTLSWNPQNGDQTQSIAPIYYTTDGSIPTTRSPQLTDQGIEIDSTVVIRFRAIEEGAIPSDIKTETYFINENHELPVISISTDPENLWSDHKGIYVVGTNGTGGNGHDNANWNQDWEIPIGFEFYDQEKIKQLDTGAGAKIFGGWSRLNAMKSLAIFFRSEYGLGEVDYRFFKDKNITQFESIVLRNSGNDFSSQGHSMFRDGLMQTLVQDTEIDGLGFQPAVVYLNGEYWGIHNIREKINEHYVASNGRVEPDEIDLLYNGSGLNYFAASNGSVDDYDALIEYVQRNLLVFPALYERVHDMMDMDNYIDYVAAQIYYANTDWPGNNTKLWKSQHPSGKWRWILYDTDFGFGLSYGGQAWHNTLTFALEPNGPAWPNPSWSTLLFRQLFDSRLFRDAFANRMADLMNSSFKPSHANTVIDSLAGLIYREIPRHMANVTRSGAWGGSTGGWYDQITQLKNFAHERPHYIEQFFTDENGPLGVGAMKSTVLKNSTTDFGVLRINRLTIHAPYWSGDYFSNIDIPVKALPKAGYEFVEWTGDVQSTDPEIFIQAGQTIEAIFAPSSDTATVVINEFMYNASDNLNSDDWVEVHNANSNPIDLTNWVFKDSDDTHALVFPEPTVLAPGEYAVITRDSSLFRTVYSHNARILGQMDFGLSGSSDQLRLFNQFGELVDSLQYFDYAPWPLNADGKGYSVALKNMSYDNSIADSWQNSSELGGSPGLVNGNLVGNEEFYDAGIPTDFSLEANYPNPFNPSTTIQFSIPVSSHVQLRIYNNIGQIVQVLADEYLPAGVYSRSFDALGLASGMYFYRLEAPGQISQTRKMMLVK